jgi:hypothetical protein
MPIHDWSRVEAGIFHDFHLGWIAEIKRVLNAGLLPSDYFALAEQKSGPFGPDVLTLRDQSERNDLDTSIAWHKREAQPSGSVLLAPPKIASRENQTLNTTFANRIGLLCVMSAMIKS